MQTQPHEYTSLAVVFSATSSSPARNSSGACHLAVPPVEAALGYEAHEAIPLATSSAWSTVSLTNDSDIEHIQRTRGGRETIGLFPRNMPLYMSAMPPA
ncbi:hypothetical protein H0H93_005654 [Arthromyces matolae]|nr:hypothetical protein H0H93_005654 [Arthromyces matolae]